MEVLLVGTGAADGWPSPFCRCGSCEAARVRGVVRGQTSGLVDDDVVIDCGPETPGAVVRHGRSLAAVRHVLFTHAHFDHLGPQVLLQRSWIPGLGELELVGPSGALDMCRDWVGPGDPVRFTPVAAGDRVRVGRYDVRVLPAKHRVFRDGDAVLYDLRGPGGERILWATDTGPWEPDWFAAVRGARFDAVFLEETLGHREEISQFHLGLPRFAEMLDGLREVGAVDAATEVVAVHLGHHNPGPDELDRSLAALGARAGVDGEAVTVRARTE